MKNLPTPSYNPEIALSNCCNAPINVCPPCFGDPEFTLCDHCGNHCERVWKPIFTKVGKGTYRRNIYEIKPLNNNS